MEKSTPTKMRRKDKEIKDPEKINTLFLEADICRLGITGDDGIPYIVPMNFAYKNNTLFFHCASEGRKLELLKKNPRVGFEIDISSGLKTADTPCSFGFNYRSLIGTGTAAIIHDRDTKIQAFDTIMDKHTNQLPPKEISGTNPQNLSGSHPSFGTFPENLNSGNSMEFRKYQYSEAALERTVVVSVWVETVSAKSSVVFT